MPAACAAVSVPHEKTPLTFQPARSLLKLCKIRVCPSACVQVFKPVPATDEALSAFHAPDYISFLKHISPDNQVPAGVRVHSACRAVIPSRIPAESADITLVQLGVMLHMLWSF